MPLVPVTPKSAIDMRWSRILLESNIDGVARTDLLDKEEIEKYSDLHGPSVAQLIRIVVDLEEKPIVRTSRGIAEDDPWHLAYLTVVGDLSPYPHPQNTWNDLRADVMASPRWPSARHARPIAAAITAVTDSTSAVALRASAAPSLVTPRWFIRSVMRGPTPRWTSDWPLKWPGNCLVDTRSSNCQNRRCKAGGITPVLFRVVPSVLIAQKLDIVGCGVAALRRCGDVMTAGFAAVGQVVRYQF